MLASDIDNETYNYQNDLEVAQYNNTFYNNEETIGLCDNPACPVCAQYKKPTVSE